jgi:hypothetical protein
MKKINLILLTIFINSLSILAQGGIEWQKSFGGFGNDYAKYVQQTSDGGYIIAGYNSSIDFWIIKLDSLNNIQWQKTYGGTNGDYAVSINQTPDGGYFVGGTSYSDNGDVIGHHGAWGVADYWVLKIDSIGNIIWQKSLGGDNDDELFSTGLTLDGGYILAGSSWSLSGDVTTHNGQADFWIVKLNGSGTIVWEKSLGGSSSEDWAYSIQNTSDNGYVLAGQSYSNDIDVSGHHGTGGFPDYWVVKLNSSGNIEWQKSLGGTLGDRATSILETTDGSFIVAGGSSSNDGDISSNHGNEDYWIVKLSSTGVVEWEKSLGGSNFEIPFSIKSTIDGGFIVAGYTTSTDGDVTLNYGISDYWIVKLNNVGLIQWTRSFGGSIGESPNCIQQTNDGGFVIAGYSESTNGDLTHHFGGADWWVVKLSPLVNIKEISNSLVDFNINPNPFYNETRISFDIPITKEAFIQIRDLEGRIIKEFISENTNNNHEILWDGTNELGTKINEGLYIITVATTNTSATKKVVIMRN